jgi:hypothetical protein
LWANDYTARMKQQRAGIVWVFILLGCLVASCSPGHLGGNEIAFVRDGHLWTIDPDGANAFEVENDSAPVLGYAWSPSHEIFFYRTLDPKFAAASAGKQVRGDPVTGLTGDVPSQLNTISIDGGSAIPIEFSNPGIAYSNAWWDANSTHLLYRESIMGAIRTPDSVQWWVSQSDQPGGIARKGLPATSSIPSFSPNNTMAIGNSSEGVFSTRLDGSNLRYLIQPEPAGHPLPSALERFLWQPAHGNPAILYAALDTSATSIPSAVQLLIRAPNGQTQVMATCACNQFAWSPDGNKVLYSVGATFTVQNIAQDTAFSVNAEADSVPYWSPDSQFLLLDGQHTVQLINARDGQRQILLSDGSPQSAAASVPGATTSINALLQPIANSLWASDSHHFVFVTRGRLLWQGTHLSKQGLYTATIDDQGQVQGTPTLVDASNDSQPGWSYEDANTSFLY